MRARPVREPGGAGRNDREAWTRHPHRAWGRGDCTPISSACSACLAWHGRRSRSMWHKSSPQTMRHASPAVSLSLRPLGFASGPCGTSPIGRAHPQCPMHAAPAWMVGHL